VKRKGLLKGLLQWCHGAGSILHRAQGGLSACSITGT
jgi:hypothetical protein